MRRLIFCCLLFLFMFVSCASNDARTGGEKVGDALYSGLELASTMPCFFP